MKKILMSGNEAIALGAFEAGAAVGTGYPGTPSSEILQTFTTYPDVYTEWSVNEKVALEVGLGSALAGARTLVTMKHVGVNVAADPLFTSSYTGIKGGLVIVTADDPQIHSSQNEQDNRNYAYAAKIPMLEPSDSQEAKDFTALGMEISEQFDTPVFLRSTTRISHSRTVLIPSEKPKRGLKPKGFERNLKKYVMIPAHSRLRHVVVEERLKALEEYSNKTEINRIELKDKSIGIISSGISYTYVKEAFPNASVLKLGMVFPLPYKLIREFASKVDKLIIVEELDPFFELRIKAQGIEAEGKKYLPEVGEFSPSLICEALKDVIPESVSNTENLLKPVNFSPKVKIPPRPPSLCPGCPHRLVFTVLSKLNVTVSGDIGCYTLSVLPPFCAMDTCIDMGASVTVAQGIEIAMDEEYKADTVAVIGDSTFAHSGITGLLNAAYNKRNSLVIVLDNGTTAMTGMQPNPLSGTTINGEKTVQLDYVKLAEACGINSSNVKIVDAYSKKDIEKAIPEMLAKKSLSLLVVKGECIILKRKKKRK
jgi:indolepyruvate ferredoxin oxidoreductase, alpha subunit